MVKVKIRYYTHTTTIIINYLSVILTLLRTGHTPQGAVVSVLGVSVMRLTLYTFFPVAYPDISSTELWIYSTYDNTISNIQYIISIMVYCEREMTIQNSAVVYIMYVYPYIINYLFCIVYVYNVYIIIYIIPVQYIQYNIKCTVQMTNLF